MLALTVGIGKAVQIGEAAVVKVEDKQGRAVKLIFATDISPIRILDDGVIPLRFTRGITGRPRPY